MRLEDTIQAAIVAFVRAVAPQIRIMAIPNAARRTASDRASNAVHGLTPGAPDLVMAYSRGRTLWIEVKTPKGRLSLEQTGLHHDLGALDHDVIVARSIDDIREAFMVRQISTREAA